MLSLQDLYKRFTKNVDLYHESSKSTWIVTWNPDLKDLIQIYWQFWLCRITSLGFTSLILKKKFDSNSIVRQNIYNLRIFHKSNESYKSLVLLTNQILMNPVTCCHESNFVDSNLDSRVRSLQKIWFDLFNSTRALDASHFLNLRNTISIKKEKRVFEKLPIKNVPFKIFNI